MSRRWHPVPKIDEIEKATGKTLSLFCCPLENFKKYSQNEKIIENVTKSVTGRCYDIAIKKKTPPKPAGGG